MATSTSPPIDRGFAWVVLLACAVTRMLVDGFWASLGIFYVEWQIRFDASTTSIAWIGFAFMFVLYVAGPVASALSHKLTYKAVTIFSGALTSVSLFALSFASELWHIYLIIPICGIGLGMAFQHGFTFFVYYFDKRYALASLLNGALSGLAYFTLPPLLETMNSIYGLSGALQISAALMLNISVCGMLMRQPTWEIHRSSYAYDEKHITGHAENIQKLYDMEREVIESPVPQKTTFLIELFKNISKSLNVTIFCKVRILFQGVLTPFLYGGVMVVMLYMVPSGVEAGVSALKSSLLVSVAGISSVCTRLSPIGCMVDRKLISASLLGGIATIIGGFATLAFPFTTTYFQMVLISTVFGGAIVGIGGSMYPVLIRDAAGSSKNATGALAYSNLVYGIGGVTGNLLTGFLHDLTGSYKSAYLLGGSYFICMGLTMLSDPYLIKWQARIDARKTNKRCGNKVQV